MLLKRVVGLMNNSKNKLNSKTSWLFKLESNAYLKLLRFEITLKINGFKIKTFQTY